MVCHAALLQKRKSHGISCQVYGLSSSFLSNTRFQMVLDGKSSQDYLVTAGVPQGSILSPTRFLVHTNDLLDDVICNSAIYAYDATFNSNVIRHLICDNK